VQILVASANPLQNILFGSYARGEATEDSDLDLLVIEQHVVNSRLEMIRLERELRIIGFPVDVLVVSQAYFNKWSEAVSTTLYWVQQEGKVVYDAAA